MSTKKLPEYRTSNHEAGVSRSERIIRSSITIVTLLLAVLLTILVVMRYDLEQTASAGGVKNTALPAQPTAPLPTSNTLPSPQPTSAVEAKRLAERAIQQQYAPFLRRPLTLVYGGMAWTPSQEELGLDLVIIDALREKIEIRYDTEAVQRYVQDLVGEIEQPAVDARVVLEDTTLVTESATLGRQLQVDTSVATVIRALESGQSTRVELDVQDLRPRLDDAAVAAATTQIASIARAPFLITAGQREFTWQPDEILSMLVLQREARDAATDHILVTIDQQHLAQHVAEIAQATGQKRENPRVAWNGGNLQIMRPGVPGSGLDEANAPATILTALLRGERSVTLPLQTITPEVTAENLASLGIQETVAIGKSDFTGSANYRITNIGVGMKLLNGVLIAPGEEFSFNATVGEINAENGFVEGYAIIDNRTQLEFGGGICQDSTTVFRAAFWAGLPITERKEHSYYISWYDRYGLGPQGDGPGLDAAIFTGVQDLKFVNDTGNWLLMEAFSDPKRTLAQVTLYGTKPNRSVSITQQITERMPAITEPVFFADPTQARGTMKRTDTARGGMKIEVYRTVTENGQARAPELFNTSFKPWADKYAVNPGDLGPDGRPNFNAQPMSAQGPSVQPTADPHRTGAVDQGVQSTPDPNAPASVGETPIPAH